MSELGNDRTKIKKVIIMDYNLKQLAAIYDISKYLLRNKLKDHKDKIGKPKGYEYDSKQVATIFELIPLPSNVQIVQVKNPK